MHWFTWLNIIKNKMIHTSIFQRHIHKVKFYPSADDFTQAPLVMLVTNIMSATVITSNGQFDDHDSINLSLWFVKPAVEIITGDIIIIILMIMIQSNCHYKSQLYYHRWHHHSSSLVLALATLSALHSHVRDYPWSSSWSWWRSCSCSWLRRSWWHQWQQQ